MMLKLLKILPLLLLISNCTEIKKAEMLPEIILEDNDPHLVGVNYKKHIINDQSFHVELIKILGTKNFSTKEENRLHRKIVPRLQETMRSQCFKDFILNSEMIQTNNQANEAVYKNLTENTIGIKLEMYYSRTSTVGYTYKDSDTIWQNRKFHGHFTICQSASNLAHEAKAHKSGYGHDSRSTSRRPKSVPYTVNRAFDKCCIQTEVKKSCSRSWRTLWLKVTCK